MKLSVALLVLSVASVASFAPTSFRYHVQQQQQKQQQSALQMGTPGMDLSGNTWKPDSEKMGSTDTGDYFPEGYNPDQEIAFTR